MTFYVGQKVVCVEGCSDHRWPVTGHIYHIRGFSPGGYVRLAEIINAPELGLGYEGGYYPRRFRPLVEKKTDISIFKKMLIPSNLHERIDA